MCLCSIGCARVAAWVHLRMQACVHVQWACERVPYGTLLIMQAALLQFVLIVIPQKLHQGLPMPQAWVWQV